MRDYVCKVFGAPDYMIVLADDCTLDNLVRFCIPSGSHAQVLSVDPTFSLGHFEIFKAIFKMLWMW